MNSKWNYTYCRLNNLILSGRFRPGEKLPSEPELARQLGVGRGTLRLALEKLESEDRIVRSRTAGTVVKVLEENRPTILVLNPPEVNQEYRNPAFHIWPGIERKCRELHWQVELVQPDFLQEFQWLDSKILGVISTVHNLNYRVTYINSIKNCGLPVVQVHGFHRDIKITGFATVTTDYRSAWTDGLRHLMRFGHRRIAIMNRDPLQSYRRNQMSEKAMLKTMDKLGLAATPELIFHPCEDGFEAAVTALLKIEPRPTAIFCYSDWMALKVFQCLRNFKVRVPEDMALLGFGNSVESSIASLPISTVDFRYQLQGEMAVDLLARHVQWENLLEKPVFYTPYDVLPRSSTEHYLFSI